MKARPIAWEITERGCWEITSHYQTKEGYGFVWIDGKMQMAHRVLWQRHNGEIPEGLCVLHKCDNPPCVNPDHLWLGTRLDNVRDRDKKGRHVKVYGEKQGNHKITTGQAKMVIEKYIPGINPAYRGNGEKLGKELGITRKQIVNIANGRSWRHLNDT